MRRYGGGLPELTIATTLAALWPRLFQALRYSGVADSDTIYRHKKGGIIPPFLYLHRDNSLYRLENIVSPGEE